MAIFPTKRSPDSRDYISLTISTAAGGLSDVGDLGGMRVAGVEGATAWTAADIAFLGSPASSASMSEVYGYASSSTEAQMVRLVSTANRITGIGSMIFDGIRFIQLASISTASTSAVAQAASRTVRLLLAPPSGPWK